MQILCSVEIELDNNGMAMPDSIHEGLHPISLMRAVDRGGLNLAFRDGVLLVLMDSIRVSYNLSRQAKCFTSKTKQRKNIREQ